jgi:LysM repeat protein
MRLAEFKKELEALEKDAGRYEEYNKLQMKYERAVELAENCRGEEALALLDECKKDVYNLKSLIAAENAKAMQESMTKNETAVSTTTNEGATCEYEVVKGDSLWKISDMKYANPLMWPMIYWANKAQIKDPDLIYPGQIFKIKKAFDESEKADAIQFSKTRGPWSLFDGK